MSRLFYLCLLYFTLLCSSNYSNAQNIDKNRFSAIFSLNDNYNSDVKEVHPHSYGEVYLITSNQAIDSTLLSFSKKLYYSQRSIIDSLKTKFNIYVIAKDNDKNSSSDRIYDDLINAKNYNRNYLFKLDGTYNMPGAIKQFELLLRSTAPFKFTKVDKKCNPTTTYCTTVIRFKS